MISAMQWSWAGTLARAAWAVFEEGLSPARCAACDDRLARRAVFCPICAATVHTVDPGESAVSSFAWYGGALRTALRRLKYDGRADLAAPLAELAVDALGAVEPGTIVIPVPLHPNRLIERGYNQAALLARRIASKRDLVLWPTGLERVRDTPRQARLARHARHDNVLAAFVPTRADALRGHRVLLVDDVTTTGATLDACRRALSGANVGSVRALVVAKAESNRAQGLSVSDGAGYASTIVSPAASPFETSSDLGEEWVHRP
jgi:ComF family protein